jgi:hypothetical protein
MIRSLWRSRGEERAFGGLCSAQQQSYQTSTIRLALDDDRSLKERGRDNKWLRVAKNQ